MLLSGEKKRYCWTRIHPYDVNYLEAFTDNVKHPNWKIALMDIAIKNAQFKVSSPVFILGNFNMKFMMRPQQLGQVQELSVNLRVKLQS